jgi:hypothetical protein
VGGAAGAAGAARLTVDDVLDRLALSDGCDLVYALVVERLERHVLAERQVAMIAKLGGAKSVEVPTFAAELGKLDRLLGEDETRKRRDPEQQALIEALGLT